MADLFQLFQQVAAHQRVHIQEDHHLAVYRCQAVQEFNMTGPAKTGGGPRE